MRLVRNRKITPTPPHLMMEPLEHRTHLNLGMLGDVLPPENINLTRRVQNQSQASIAIDPSASQRVFVMSNLEFDPGLFTALSTDGGATWSRRVVADGADGLRRACCDGRATFDDSGNLYIAYVNAARSSVEVARSEDGGQTFERVAHFRGDVEQPTIAAGPGGIWLVFEQDGRIAITGARVDDQGNSGDFKRLKHLDSAADSGFADLSIGPAGQVMVTYQSPVRGKGPSRIFVITDPDGFGGEGFRRAVRVTRTRVGGFRSIPSQPKGLIDARPGIVYDRSGGEFDGRAYLVYSDLTKHHRDDIDVRIRFSDDDGATWSKAFRVSDDPSRRSQFLPRIALDQTTGRLGFSWHDARNDDGKRGNGDRNGNANDDTQLWGKMALPTEDGFAFSDDFQISEGTSNAPHAENRIDYGDYHALAFHAGVMQAAWADNSNSTRDNPNNRLKFEVYTSRILV